MESCYSAFFPQQESDTQWLTKQQCRNPGGEGEEMTGWIIPLDGACKHFWISWVKSAKVKQIANRLSHTVEPQARVAPFSELIRTTTKSSQWEEGELEAGLGATGGTLRCKKSQTILMFAEKSFRQPMFYLRDWSSCPIMSTWSVSVPAGSVCVSLVSSLVVQGVPHLSAITQVQR